MERESVNKTVTPANHTSDADPILTLTATMATLTISAKESRLLALPMELLEQISDCVTEESLPMLRLACKTLEAATLNRFTTVFLQERRFHVHDETRWLLLNNLLSTRFAKEMREITLTTDELEGKPYSMLQLAPKKSIDKDDLVGEKTARNAWLKC